MSLYLIMNAIGNNIFSGVFADKRLDDRANSISEILLNSNSSSVNGITNNEAELKGFYRFLENERVEEQLLISGVTSKCGINVKGKDVLAIQDSSSIGFSRNAKNIKPNSGLGFIGNKIGTGFMLHTALVLDANNESMLGLSDIQMWHRKEDKSNNKTRIYKKQPIEEKESYKWIKGANQIKSELQLAKSITIIEDREGDIYEQFCTIPDVKTNLIIRNRDNRRLTSGKKLHDVLNTSPSIGEYEFELKGDIRKKLNKRKIQLEVKVVCEYLKKPDQIKVEGIPDNIEVHIIEAKEKESRTDSICWRLITTTKVVTFEDAVNIINKYKSRWYIEQLFRLIKKQGFQIEQSQLESGWSIRKLMVLVLHAACRQMQLYLAYEEKESQPILEVFDENEINCLKCIMESKITTTPNTMNQNDTISLSWASWIIARIGGWKGNAKQTKAGPITIIKGLKKFESIYEGWKIGTLNVSK